MEHVAEQLIALLLMSTVVAIAVKYIKLPYTIALVLAGLAIGLSHIGPDLHLSPELVFVVILPALLFQGGLNLHFQHLKKNLKPILFLAIPGVLLSTAVTGFVFHWLTGIDLKYSLLFGAMITPTDPISVLAIFKEFKVPERLRVIVEGESLFNDGTGVVLFKALLAIVIGTTDFSLAATIGNFVFVILGGCALGFGIGYVAYQLLKRLNDHLLEVMITIIVAYGSFLVAEMFHVSGVISTVVAGLVIGNPGRKHAMEQKTEEALTHFWDEVDFILNSLLFIMIGLALQDVGLKQLFSVKSPEIYLLPVLAGIAAHLAGRAVGIYPVTIVLGVMKNGIPGRWGHILFWGGIKGSIPLALVLMLKKPLAGTPGMYNQMLVVCFMVVLFSLIMQGLTMGTLLKICDPEKGYTEK